MRRTALVTAAATALLCTACIALAPALAAMDLATLPSDTQWFLALDTRAALGGQFGQLVRDVLARPEFATKLAALGLITGFDPLKDLDAVTVAGSAAGDAATVIIAEGRFDRSRLTTLVTLADGYAVADHAGVAVHRWRDQDKPGKPMVYAAFLGERQLALSSGEPALDHVIDAASATTRFSPPSAPAGAGLIAWGQAENLGQLSAGNAQAAMLTNVQQASLAISERDSALSGELDLVATDAATAEQLAKLANGLQALSALGSSPTQDPLAAELLAGLRATQAGSTVRLSTACPLATLRALPALGLGH